MARELSPFLWRHSSLEPLFRTSRYRDIPLYLLRLGYVHTVRSPHTFPMMESSLQLKLLARQTPQDFHSGDETAGYLEY